LASSWHLNVWTYGLTGLGAHHASHVLTGGFTGYVLLDWFVGGLPTMWRIPQDTGLDRYLVSTAPILAGTHYPFGYHVDPDLHV